MTTHHILKNLRYNRYNNWNNRKCLYIHKDILRMVICIKIETTITEISGSFYVRIPANFVEFFKLKTKPKAIIEDISATTLKVTFKKE